MDISMLKDWLDGPLYERAAEKLAGAPGLRIIDPEAGEWTPREEADALRERLARAQGDLEAAGAREEEMVRELALREEALRQARLRGELREELARARIRDVDLGEKLLMDGGTEGPGAAARVRALRERSPYLFEEAAGGLRAGFGGGNGGGGGGYADVNGAIRAAAGRG